MNHFFSINIDDTTEITMQQHCGIKLRNFDNEDDALRCVLLNLEPVKNADADILF